MLDKIVIYVLSFSRWDFGRSLPSPTLRVNPVRIDSTRLISLFWLGVLVVAIFS